jgi:8-oxo-dGTP pyrophosphatase MutT (NUDIX family)
MKFNNNTKPEYYYNQSAVIPYRFSKSDVEILLITSIKKKQWVIPKGIIEDNLSPQESACKEAFEEAGISGTVVGNMIGEYTYEKWGGVCRVRVYLFEVDTLHKSWPESNLRERRWFSLEKAKKVINSQQVTDILASLSEILSNLKKKNINS